MTLKHPKILLTGPPRVGKTTLVRKAAARIPAGRAAGFFTTEILQGGMRKGFALAGLNGEKGILAHEKFSSRFRVGKYGVDVDGFEAFLDRLGLWGPKIDCIVIDEIGKMEVFSALFCSLVRRIADADKQLLGTVAARGGGLIAEVKQRPDIRILAVTESNRDALLDRIVT